MDPSVSGVVFHSTMDRAALRTGRESIRGQTPAGLTGPSISEAEPVDPVDLAGIPA